MLRFPCSGWSVGCAKLTALCPEESADLCSFRAARCLLQPLLAGTLIGAATPFGRPAQAGSAYLPGIDVSRWQGEIDWAKVNEHGIRFVFAKASQGNCGRPPGTPPTRLVRRRRAIAFGAYHFADPAGGTADAIAQADHFVDTAGLGGKNLLPVLDMERENGLSPKALRRWARAWLDRVEERLGVKAIIYTNYYFWRDEMGDPHIVRAERLPAVDSPLRGARAAGPG